MFLIDMDVLSALRKRERNPADLLIAATALDHGLTVVTCNIRHFKPTGVPVVDPSAPCS